MTLADQIEALDAKATAQELRDGGRYFADSCNDLTRCGHGDTGEYTNKHDGPLIELLWNNRAEIIAALRLAETSSTHGQYDPNDPANERALADRVETSAALPDVAGLVEPSDDERSQWPEATEAYVLGLEAVLTAQAQRIAELEGALQWYADPSTWFGSYCVGTAPMNDDISCVDGEIAQGKRARAALKGGRDDED